MLPVTIVINNPVILAIINICIAVTILIVDLHLPADTAIGVLYVIVIMFSLWMPKIKHTVYLSILCSTFTLVAFYQSTTQDITFPSPALSNMLVTLLAIWITTTLASYRKTLTNKLRKSEKRQAAILSSSLDPIITFNTQGVIQSASNSITPVFGWPLQDIIGEHVSILVDEPFKTKINTLLESAAKHNLEILNAKQEITGIHINGKKFSCEISLAIVYSLGVKKPFFSATIRDISEKKASEKKLIWLSTHDELTGIYNRRYFKKQIEKEWHRLIRNPDYLSLIIVDVDHFKNYNDTLGHQAGDACLQKIAHALPKRLKRTTDFAARYGGEEFCILLPNTALNGAIKIAKLIHKEIHNLKIPHPVTQVGGYITVSMGISSILPTNNSSYDVLIKSADHALYQAKKQGRNRYAIFKQ